MFMVSEMTYIKVKCFHGSASGNEICFKKTLILCLSKVRAKLFVH